MRKQIKLEKNCFVRHAQRGYRKHLGIELVTPRRIYEFIADNKPIKQEWMRVIYRSIITQRGTGGTPCSHGGGG